jgi:hypothetical protein
VRRGFSLLFFSDDDADDGFGTRRRRRARDVPVPARATSRARDVPRARTQNRARERATTRARRRRRRFATDGALWLSFDLSPVASRHRQRDARARATTADGARGGDGTREIAFGSRTR